MTNKKHTLGRNLRSLTTQLTRWMRRGSKVEEKVKVEEYKEEAVAETPAIIAKPKPKVIRSRPAPKPTLESIVEEKPIIIDEPEPQSQLSTSSILQSFPENKNLVGHTEILFELHDKKHALMIRTDCLYLDAQKYLISANGGALGGDVELDILECKRTHDTLSIKIGAFGKDVTIRLNSDEATAMFELLLKGKTSKHTAERGQAIEITRNNY